MPLALRETARRGAACKQPYRCPRWPNSPQGQRAHREPERKCLLASATFCIPTHTVRSTGCGGIIAFTSDGTSCSATDDVACVAGSMAASPSERPSSGESDEASGRGEDGEVVELHVGSQ